MTDAAAREGLLTSEQDGIAVVTIDRPSRRNALSRVLLGALAKQLAGYEGSPVRAVVLEGSQGCFSAGADLEEIEGTLADFTMDEAVATAARAIRSLSLPVIAAIEGPCVGAGVELAMACDLRVASRSAFFRVPAVRLGLLYRPGAVADLSARLPPDLLTRMLLFGDVVGAEEAAGSGIVAPPVVANLSARERALELAGLLPDPPSQAASATKRLLIALAGNAETDAVAASFEELRRAIAVSPARAAALAAARQGRKRAVTEGRSSP